MPKETVTTRFIVKRTSVWDEEKPCDEAYRFMPKYVWHERTCTEEYFDENFSFKEGKWLSKGTEHQKTNNGKWIKRKEKTKEEVWVVDILDVLSFSKKYGDIIVSSYSRYDIPTLEIYDIYRE